MAVEDKCITVPSKKNDPTLITLRAGQGGRDLYSTVQGVHVDEQEEYGIEEEWLLVPEFVSGQEGASAVRCPHHAKTL